MPGLLHSKPTERRRTAHSVEHETVEAVAQLIRRLNDEARNGALVVVEGRRDATALRSLGFTGELSMLSYNQSFVELVEHAKAFKRVVLLLDLDEKGRKLTKRIALLLQEKKITIDLFFRRELASATKGAVRHVEELSRFRGAFEPLA